MSLDTSCGGMFQTLGIFELTVILPKMYKNSNDRELLSFALAAVNLTAVSKCKKQSILSSLFSIHFRPNYKITVSFVSNFKIRFREMWRGAAKRSVRCFMLLCAYHYNFIF